MTVSMHLLALVACLGNALPFVLRLLGVAMVAASLMLSLRENRVTSRAIGLNYSEAGGWTLCVCGDTHKVEIMASTVYLSWLIVLHYRVMQERDLRTLLIFRDAVGDENYRKLKVALRIVSGS